MVGCDINLAGIFGVVHYGLANDKNNDESNTRGEEKTKVQHHFAIFKINQALRFYFPLAIFQVTAMHNLVDETRICMAEMISPKIMQSQKTENVHERTTTRCTAIVAFYARAANMPP